MLKFWSVRRSNLSQAMSFNLKYPVIKLWTQNFHNKVQDNSCKTPDSVGAINKHWSFHDCYSKVFVFSVSLIVSAAHVIQGKCEHWSNLG